MAFDSRCRTCGEGVPRSRAQWQFMSAA